jgi:hypothetical protein
MEVYLHAFLTLALNKGEWSASHPACFHLQGNRHQHPLDRRQVGPQNQSGYGDKEKRAMHMAGIELGIQPIAH